MGKVNYFFRILFLNGNNIFSSFFFLHKLKSTKENFCSAYFCLSKQKSINVLNNFKIYTYLLNWVRFSDINRSAICRTYNQSSVKYRCSNPVSVKKYFVLNSKKEVGRFEIKKNLLKRI